MGEVKKHLKDKLSFWKKRLKDEKKELKNSELYLKKKCYECVPKRCIGHRNKDVKEALEQIEAYQQMIIETNKAGG